MLAGPFAIRGGCLNKLSSLGSFVSCRGYDKKAPKPPRIHHGKGYYVPKGLPSPLSSQWLDGSFHDSKKSLTLANKAVIPLDNPAAINLKCTNIEKVILEEDNVKVFALHPKVKPLFQIRQEKNHSIIDHESIKHGFLEKENSSNQSAIPELSLDALLPPLTRLPKRHAFPDRPLSPHEIQEMNVLRQQNPFQWSILKLAAQFRCSTRQVMDYAPLTPVAYTAKKLLDEKYLSEAPLKYRKRILRRQRMAEHLEEAFHQYNY